MNLVRITIHGPTSKEPLTTRSVVVHYSSLEELQSVVNQATNAIKRGEDKPDAQKDKEVPKEH